MALTPKEIEEALNLLKKQAEQQQEINSGLDSYIKALAKAKSIQESINTNIKIENEIKRKIATLTGQAQADEQEKLRVLQKQTAELVDQGVILKDQLKDANKFKMTFGAMGATIAKGIGTLPGLFQNSFGKLKNYGLFEMDKAIKQSALDMGLVGARAKGLSTSIRESALKTTQWGMGVKELSKLQSSYSEELGRTVMMGNSGLKAISAMGVATGLGAEGAGKLTAEMSNQGLSAERTANFMKQTMNDSTKMGLNTSKVVKNIQNNMKLLNKYGFKGGVKGLAKMAQTTSKLGVDMNFVAGMAEKLFDIQGAVEMSAQLQVLGGEWAELADPFKLMYMARNDMQGLTEAVGEAAASSAHFNSETGEFEISALEMHRLRKIAEQTGLEYDNLAKAGKNAAKFSKIKQQIGFSFGGGKEGKEIKDFLTSTAEMDEKGKAFIIDMQGDKQYLDKVSKDLIKNQMIAKQELADRAKASITFDEKVTNLINMIKVTMMPIVDGIDSVLGPLVEQFHDEKFTTELKELGKSIGEFVKFGAEMVKGVGEFVLAIGPKSALALFLTGKAIGWLFEKASWIANGLLLSQGFLAGTKVGGFMQGGMAAMGTTAGKTLGAAGGAITGFGAGTAIGGGGKGAMIGSAIGTGVGALGQLIGVPMPIGMALGGMAGGYLGGKFDKPANDAIFNSPVNDAKFSLKPNLGGDFSQDRAIMQGGKITPIDNKDDLLAMKPGGGIMDFFSNMLSSNDNNKENTAKPKTNNVKVEFSPLIFKFEDLVVKTADGQSTIIAKELLNNEHFKRDIARTIHVQTQKAINQGILKG
jgi:hypothetical protein